MKRVKQLMSAVTLSILASTAVAQTAGTEQTTDNLITNTWSNTVPYTGTGGGYDGGYQPGYNPSTNTIYFGWTPQTVAETIAINQALSGTGIQISGYNYSWQYYNFSESRGSLTGQIRLTDPTGISLRSYSYSMPVQGNQWYTQSGTQNFGQLYPLPSVGGLEVSFTGVDDRGWAGYYGPQIRNVNVSLNYSVDQCSVDPQSSPACPGYKTYYTFGDDSYAIIPLPFGYPLYGRTFTHSVMFDNGVVSFYDPLAGSARLGGQQYWAEPLSNNIGSQFYYSIMPLWTDLAPDSNTKYYTQTDTTNYFKYTWEDIQQWGYSNRPNTFSLEIRPTGYLGIQYDKINIQGYPITAGVVGDASLGEWTQHFRSEGTAVVTGGIANWSLSYTQPTNCSDPLSNPACPGYAEAYQQQQCTVNPLYSTSCPGYQQAYYDQQCSINPLYNVNCPGYATAYYDYQCSIDPLYHTGCPGYETAYFNQQCSINPLYDSGCTGYQQAYFDQQCGLNGLYSTNCPNYADAYYVQQCTISPLYDTGCTGYNDAYFAQQCSIDGLYSNQCPNYAEAYALKFIVVSSPTTNTTVDAATEQTSTTQLVSDTAVNQTLTTTTTSVSPSQPVAPVQLVPAPQPVTAVAAATEEKKEEPKTETASSDSSSTSTASTSENKDQPKTTRQALAERRLAAARAKAVEEGKQLAGKMGEAASLEAQIQIQGVVMAAMGFVPGFDAYGRVSLPDVPGYKPFEIYRGQRNVDNPAGRRFLTGADVKHQEMIDAQYR